ncbi:unnamed protein product [Spirodela intermedia]|uniref:Uncharacterized protein n=1 Tax=Spirodela intermedia TaxID=51605 RepID=A0A7I8JPD0_SPIIN|nr:unnamed protein product [Spirodela intermedia]CAA6672016.1 unnamed protein product [Spirodela intermedia]
MGAAGGAGEEGNGGGKDGRDEAPGGGGSRVGLRLVVRHRSPADAGFLGGQKGSGGVGEDEDELAVEVEGVQRMWEGGVFDCLQDRQIAIETSWILLFQLTMLQVWKNMSRANLGSCFFQGAVYLFLTVAILFNAVAFMITLWHGFLYLGIVSVTSAAIYLGYSRGRIRKQFNIRARDSALDDCVSHLVCLAVLCESRTLEMNNVQDGVWHGRSDTICIGSKTFRNSANPPLSHQIPRALRHGEGDKQGSPFLESRRQPPVFLLFDSSYLKAPPQILFDNLTEVRTPPPSSLFPFPSSLSHG